MSDPGRSADHIVRTHPCGATLTVLVTPGASRNEVVGRYGTHLRVRVKARPEGGLANQAVAELLSRLFGCRVDLLSGVTGRAKRVLLRGANAADAGRTISVLRRR